MNAFTPAEMIQAHKLGGPADLYRALLTVKNGFADSEAELNGYYFTKADMKRAGINWSFVVQSCNVLGLKLENNAGKRGHVVSK